MTLHKETIAARKFSRVVADGYLVADACLVQLKGNTHPYFSVTGELWDSEGWYRNGQDGRMRECGQLHDRIARAFPKLAPVIALHLADETGAPMHAEANGWYWYSDYDGKGTNVSPHSEPLYSMTPHERGAQYLRIAPDALPKGMTRPEFASFVETLREQWQREADAALAFLREQQ